MYAQVTLHRLSKLHCHIQKSMWTCVCVCTYAHMQEQLKRKRAKAMNLILSWREERERGKQCNYILVSKLKSLCFLKHFLNYRLKSTCVF